MGRIIRTFKGMLGRVVSGTEERNPELLLENAVNDERENLKKLKDATAKTMAYEKQLEAAADEKRRDIDLKVKQARELAATEQREAAVQAMSGKQEAETALASVESQLEDARRNSEEMRRSLDTQQQRYDKVSRERGSLMEKSQRSKALRQANEARSSASATDTSRDMERAREIIKGSSYEAQAAGELAADGGINDSERQLEEATNRLKRADAEEELRQLEADMNGETNALESGNSSEDAKSGNV